MTAVDAALAEVQARIIEIAPVHEGLRDYLRLNITDETRVEVEQALADYDDMLALMQAFVTAAEALIEAEYPNLEPRLISKPAVDDLQAQLDTVTAARAQFLVNEAETLAIVPGTPESSP
jgi:hypothetical protein